MCRDKMTTRYRRIKKRRVFANQLIFLAGLTGLEPAISGLTGQRDKPTSLQPRWKTRHTAGKRGVYIPPPGVSQPSRKGANRSPFHDLIPPDPSFSSPILLQK